MANKMIDFTPVVYLKIALPDHSMLGALSFGGMTDYRTDMLFIRDLRGKIRDTLECCGRMMSLLSSNMNWLKWGR